MASRGADGDDSDDGVELSNPGPPPARKKKKLEPVRNIKYLFLSKIGSLNCLRC